MRALRLGAGALVLALLFALTIGMVRGRAVSDEALRTGLLPPSGCPAPCWEGIRPQVTSADDAFALLSAHPWVGDLNRTATHISWRWSGTQPAYIDGSSQGLIYLNGQRVATVRIAMTVRFGDVWALFHAPQSALLVRPVSRSTAYQIAGFDRIGVQVVSSLSCPARPASYWNGSVTLHVGAPLFTEMMNGAPYPVFAAPGWWRWLYRCRRISGV